MNDVRGAFLDAARVVAELLGRRDVGDRWHDQSVLEGLTIGALAGHLGRGILTPHWYLDMPEPDPPAVDAATYFARFAESTADAATDAAIRSRSEEMAAAGWARLYLDVGRARDTLAERLETEPVDKLVPAMGLALVVDEYLKTRIVELVVHLGDLTRSLALPLPDLAGAKDIAIDVLIETAKARHGRDAVLHALARRELDQRQALRVL